jgi:hypothetical protein
MAKSAYTPKEGVEPEQLGTVFVHDSLTINVREAVQEGGGYIVTDDDTAMRVLDDYAPIKRVAVSEAEEGQKKAAAKSEKSSASKSEQKPDKGGGS